MCRSLLLTAALPTLRLPANTNNSCTAGDGSSRSPWLLRRPVQPGRSRRSRCGDRRSPPGRTTVLDWSCGGRLQSRASQKQREPGGAESGRSWPNRIETPLISDGHGTPPAAAASRHRTGHLPLRRRTQLRLAPRMHTSPSWLGTTSRHPRSPSRTRLLPHHPPTGRLIVLAVVKGTALVHRQWTGCKGDHGDHLIRDGCGSPSWSSLSAGCVSHAPVSAPLSCLGRPTRRERNLLVERDDFIPDRYEPRRCVPPSDPSQRCLECRSLDDLVKCVGHLKFVRSRMVMTACRSGIRDTTPRV